MCLVPLCAMTKRNRRQCVQQARARRSLFCFFSGRALRPTSTHTRLRGGRRSQATGRADNREEHSSPKQTKKKHTRRHPHAHDAQQDNKAPTTTSTERNTLLEPNVVRMTHTSARRFRLFPPSPRSHLRVNTHTHTHTHKPKCGKEGVKRAGNGSRNRVWMAYTPTTATQTHREGRGGGEGRRRRREREREREEGTRSCAPRSALSSVGATIIRSPPPPLSPTPIPPIRAALILYR